MARQGASAKTVQSWINDYPDLSFNGVELSCKVCNVNLSYTRKTSVIKHMSSKRHQTFIGGDKQQRFNLDLVKFMVGCNIPWSQLDNPVFKEFIDNCVGGQYAEAQVPSSSTLRKAYLPQVADDIICYVRSELESKHIWISVDETTNVNGLNVANVLVGPMEELHTTRGQLIASRVLQAANADSVCTLVGDSLKLLWGDRYEECKDNFLLLITNGKDYMKAAGQMLREAYDFLHVTCMAQALHRVAETVKNCYPNVDALIINVKKVFFKAPEHTQLFYEIVPNVELPPEPDATRCGTWLDAAKYYFLHLEDVRQVLRELGSSQTAAVASAQEALMDPTLQGSLQEIHNCFSRIPLAIQHLEQDSQSGDFSLVDQMNVVYDLRYYISFLPGEIARRVRQTLEDSLASNPGFHTLSCIEKLLRREEVDLSLPGIHKRSLHNYQLFRYARVTSTDIGKSFTLYKWIFSDKRRRLTPSHLEQILIIYFYYRTADHDD